MSDTEKIIKLREAVKAALRHVENQRKQRKQYRQFNLNQDKEDCKVEIICYAALRASE